MQKKPSQPNHDDGMPPDGSVRPGQGIRTASWQLGLAAVVLAAGLIAAGWMGSALRRQEAARIEEAFQQAADKVFSRTLREIQLFMEVLDSIRQLHSLSDQVSPEAFSEIAQKGMIYQRRILGAYGFAQRMTHSMRSSAEQQGLFPGGLVQMDDAGGFRRCPVRPVYFPLTYQTPPGGLGVPKGFDFASRPSGQAAISAMNQYGIFALGGHPAGTLPSAEDELYMFAPIFRALPGKNRELDGFAIGLFPPHRILEKAMMDAPSGLRVRLVPTMAAGIDSDESAASPLRFERSFSLANQEWGFVAEADDAYMASIRERTPEWTAGAVVLVTLALVLALVWMAGRARRIEALVQRRTRQLAEANHRLEAVMEERRELEDEVLKITGHEKERIGRDLHDSLGQKLTGAMYLFQAFRKQVGAAGSEKAETDAAQIAATLKETVTQVRRIARGLAPVALTEDGLPDALRRLAEESASLFRADIEFYAEREGRPRDTGTAEHLYLIAQEALNNAVKHGQSTRIVLSLDYDDQGGELVIEDNGCGLPENPVPDRDGGNGLRIMRHRADVFGGTLRIETAASGGVRVVCRFPKA